MIKRGAIAASLLLPISWLVVSALFPSLDPILEVPLLHFYIVTFFTFAATVVAFLAAVALEQVPQARHRLLATTYAVMGSVFFIHGVATPGVFVLGFNPGVRWAAWLTLFLGGITFAVAGLDRPDRPLKTGRLRPLHRALALFILIFTGVVALAPDLLTWIDTSVAPWHQQAAFWSTLLLWLFAAGALWRTWRQTGARIDGIMVLIALWSAVGTISMHAFELWQFAWWLYHLMLLMGAVAALAILAHAYEQVRRFRIVTYYAALGLIVTAGLSLLGSYLVARLVEHNLGAAPYSEGAYLQMLVGARLSGLLIVAGAMMLLFLALLGVIWRADGLVRAQTEQLREAYRELRAVESMRDDLTDMIVHDLRTPLTAMKLNVGLLERIADDPAHAERRQRFFAGLHDAVARMLSLVNQILDVARLESRQLQPGEDVIAVDDLLWERAETFALRAEMEGKQINVAVAEGTGQVRVDRELVARVLDNLIGNALKYTQADGSLTLGAKPAGEYTILAVVDDGEGIDPEAAEQLFDKYYQVRDADGKALRQGTGLGLTFCKLVVEAHGGRIWVESEPGRGSTFRFTLPRVPAAAPLPYPTPA